MELIDLTDGQQIGVEDYLRLFNQFSKEEQMIIAEKISLQTFKERWAILDENLPDTGELSDEDIIEEVRKVRYA